MVFKQRKILVMGSPAVGKSSISIQFVESRFVESYNPTIENTFSKTFRFKGVEYETKIVDTAGYYESDAFEDAHTVGVHGYILAYSITSRSSFEMLKSLNEKILNACGTDRVPRLICGNKSDLEKDRQVSVKEVAALADSWGCTHVECSAKHNENIVDLFNIMIAEIEKTNQVNESKKPAESSGCVIC